MSDLGIKTMGALRCRSCRGVRTFRDTGDYIGFQNDSARRWKAGERQAVCEGCGLYEWRKEFAAAKGAEE